MDGADLWFVLCVACVVGFLLGCWTRLSDVRFWRDRSDYWFTRAMSRSIPSFHHHPHFHATRSYPSLDAFLADISGDNADSAGGWD